MMISFEKNRRVRNGIRHDDWDGVVNELKKAGRGWKSLLCQEHLIQRTSRQRDWLRLIDLYRELGRHVSYSCYLKQCQIDILQKASRYRQREPYVRRRPDPKETALELLLTRDVEIAPVLNFRWVSSPTPSFIQVAHSTIGTASIYSPAALLHDLVALDGRNLFSPLNYRQHIPHAARIVASLSLLRMAFLYKPSEKLLKECLTYFVSLSRVARRLDSDKLEKGLMGIRNDGIKALAEWCEEAGVELTVRLGNR